MSQPNAILCRSRLVVVLTIACFWAPTSNLNAQGKTESLADRAMASQNQAKDHLQKGQFREAEKAYLGAMKDLEQQMAAKNTDALVLGWCQCRADLAHAQFALLKFSEAKTLLTDTISYLNKVIPLRPKDQAFRHELAKLHGEMSGGYNHFKLHAEAAASQQESIDLLKQLSNEFPEYGLELSKCLNRHGRELVLLGRFQDMEASYNESLRLVEKLHLAAPKSPEYAHQLAVTYSSYAYQLHESGRAFDTIAMTRAAIRLLSKLEADHPDQPRYWFPLPIQYRNLAEPPGYARNDSEASAAIREAQRLERKLDQVSEASRTWIRDDQKALARLLSSHCARLADRQDELEDLYRRAEKNAGSPDSDAFQQWSIASAKSLRGLKLFHRGNKDEAKKESAQSIEIVQRLVARNPDLPLYRALLLEFYYAHSLLHFSVGEMDRGHDVLRQWIAMNEKLADDYPKVPDFRYQLSEKLARIATNFAADRKEKDAAHYYKISHDALNRLAKDFPECSKYRRCQAEDFSLYAMRLHQADSMADAEPVFREGLKHWRKVVADFPGIPDFQRSMAVDHTALGSYLEKMGKYQTAEDSYAAALRIIEGLLKENPKEAQFHSDLAKGHLALGYMKETQGHLADAVVSYTKAIAVQENAFRSHPKQRNRLTDLRAIVQRRADVHLKQGNHKAYYADSQRITDLGEALDAPILRLHRIDDRAKKGHATAALKEADDLFHNIELTDAQWRDLAVFYTEVAANATDAKQKEDIAGRAVASLRNAIDQGLAPAGLADDQRFRALAPRDDFRKLITPTK